MYTARDTLREWQDKNHPWLELTDIHRETTENIRVTVMPFYIGSRVSLLSFYDRFTFFGSQKWEKIGPVLRSLQYDYNKG
jgi:hypothetical protein